jgi:hypothetical protein
MTVVKDAERRLIIAQMRLAGASFIEPFNILNLILSATTPPEFLDKCIDPLGHRN